MRTQGHQSDEGTLNPGSLAPQVGLGSPWWPGESPPPANPTAVCVTAAPELGTPSATAPTGPDEPAPASVPTSSLSRLG